MKSWRLRAVASALVVGLLPAMAQACAVCWGGDDALARGLNTSILFLMAMPFFIGGSIIGVIVVAQKRAQGRRWRFMASERFAWTQKESVK